MQEFLGNVHEFHLRAFNKQIHAIRRESRTKVLLFVFDLSCPFALRCYVCQIYFAVAKLGEFLIDNGIDQDLKTVPPSSITESGMKVYVKEAAAELRERLIHPQDPTDHSLKASFTFRAWHWVTRLSAVSELGSDQLEGSFSLVLCLFERSVLTPGLFRLFRSIV